MDILGDLTSEIIDLIHSEYSKEDNKKKMNTIINDIMWLFLDNIQPYFITIVVILGLLFLMNTVQFYYYIKLLLKGQGCEICRMK